jgi:hypothetical protein
MVIAIERNHWPKEWRFLIRLEVLGNPLGPAQLSWTEGLSTQ